MTGAYDRLKEGLDELARFAAGEGPPLLLYVPDGKGGLVPRTVANMDEYHKLCVEEGQRVIRAVGEEPRT